MTFEEQELVSQLVRTALLAENENEALTALRVVSRKMATFGFDRRDLGVFDQSKGVSTTVAANAIKRRQAERAEEADRVRKAEGSAAKAKTTIAKQKKQIARLKAQIADRAIELEALRGRVDTAEALVEKVGEIYVESIVERALRRVDQRNAMSSS